VVTPHGATAHLTWAAATLTSGQAATGYVVHREAAGVTTELCRTNAELTCTDQAPVAGLQRYRVQALFGRWTSPASPDTTYAYNPDVLAPTTSATPDGSAWLTTDPAPITLAASDAGGSGVAEIRYRVDNGPWASAAGSSTSVSLAGQGLHTLAFRAVDKAGNQEALRTLDFRIDSNAPPQPTGLTVATDSGTSTKDRITNVGANRLLGVGEPGAIVEVRRGGSLIATGIVGPAGTFEVPVTLTQGQQTLSVRIVDPAGNMSATGSLDVTLDTVAPVVVANPPNLQNRNRWNRVCSDLGLPPGLCGTAVDATSSTAQVSYELRRATSTGTQCWNGTMWGSSCGYRTTVGTSPWSVSLPWTSLGPGSYELRSSATDIAGNVSITSSPTLTFVRS
jgi:hypothetical protein